MSSKKALYIKDIASRLIKDYQGRVPNDRKYLESLKGVGHKTCNIILYNLFNIPAFAVDTHVSRVANRLNITDKKDVLLIEKDLEKYFPKEEWGKRHHQLVLFGRYICKAKKPECSNCLLKKDCNYYR